MRKSIKILLFIASGLVGVGILFMCLSVALGGTDIIFKPKEKSKVTIMSATFDEVDGINIKDVSHDVQIIKSENDQVKVTYGVSENFNYDVKQIEGTLYVEYEDLRQWHDYLFNFNINNADLVVEVPEATLNELNIKTTSGDIEVGGSVGVLYASATSGDVKLNSDTDAESAQISTTSGKLTLSGNVKGEVKADNTSGGIILDNLNCSNADLKTTSGKIKGNNLRLTSLTADTVSGGISLTDTICTEDMDLETTSGSIELENVDAENYSLSTTSGSVKAEILNPKLYNVKSTSGSQKIPEFDENAQGVLSAKTTSGSIKIELAD